MTSNEIHQQITAFVGERVDEAEYRAKAQQNARPCPDCAASYERELATRMVVHDRSAPPSEPAAPRGVIGNHAAMNGTVKSDEAKSDAAPEEPVRAATTAPPREAGSGLLASPIGIVVALLVVIASAWALFASKGQGEGKIIVENPPAKSGSTGTSAAAKGPENLFNKAADNFSAIMDGTLTAQHATADQGELATYFKENGVAYNVAFAPVRATLVGGVISQHGDTRLAHVIFSKGEATIYLFEIPNDILRKGNIVTVSDEVLKRLDAGETLWEQPGGHTLAMFRKGDLICVVVANLWKEELFPIISTK